MFNTMSGNISPLGQILIHFSAIKSHGLKGKIRP